MAKKKETLFRRKADKLFESIPGIWLESIQQKSIRGTPDKLGCLKGFFIAIEYKTTTGGLAALQLYKLNKIRDAGGLAFKVDESNLESIYNFLLSLSLGDGCNSQENN